MYPTAAVSTVDRGRGAECAACQRPESALRPEDSPEQDARYVYTRSMGSRHQSSLLHVCNCAMCQRANVRSPKSEVRSATNPKHCVPRENWRGQASSFVLRGLGYDAPSPFFPLAPRPLPPRQGHSESENPSANPSFAFGHRACGLREDQRIRHSVRSVPVSAGRQRV